MLQMTRRVTGPVVTPCYLGPLDVTNRSRSIRQPAPASHAGCSTSEEDE